MTDLIIIFVGGAIGPLLLLALYARSWRRSVDKWQRCFYNVVEDNSRLHAQVDGSRKLIVELVHDRDAYRRAFEGQVARRSEIGRHARRVQIERQRAVQAATTAALRGKGA